MDLSVLTHCYGLFCATEQRTTATKIPLLSKAPDHRLPRIYAQDEMFLSDHFRWTVGARLDRFDYLNDVVFSPRTAFLIKPQENQTIRLSYNRAYRAPSVINNWLSTVIARPVDLRAPAWCLRHEPAGYSRPARAQLRRRLRPRPARLGALATAPRRRSVKLAAG